MYKIIAVSVPEYRKIHVTFADGAEGTIVIDDDFHDAGKPLGDPDVFASAHIIDEGYAIGFANCEYDICASWAYAQVSSGMPASMAM